MTGDQAWKPGALTKALESAVIPNARNGGFDCINIQDIGLGRTRYVTLPNIDAVEPSGTLAATVRIMDLRVDQGNLGTV